MGSRQQNWAREELLLAINLYCQIPFGRIHNRNPEIIELAERIGRSPSAVSYKLANFAHLDKSLDRKGASNVSKLDIEVWNEFQSNWDRLVLESELLKHQRALSLEELDSYPEGKEVIRTVKTRVNQNFFRNAVLSNYDFTCCITGIPIKELLIASHIKPWSVDEAERLNPKNGLCLSALHDRAFDQGLISLDQDYRVILSSQLKKAAAKSQKVSDYLCVYENQQISSPKKFWPDPAFVAYHRNKIFAA